MSGDARCRGVWDRFEQVVSEEFLDSRGGMFARKVAEPVLLIASGAVCPECNLEFSVQVEPANAWIFHGEDGETWAAIQCPSGHKLKFALGPTSSRENIIGEDEDHSKYGFE